jgi:hypothetical protein
MVFGNRFAAKDEVLTLAIRAYPRSGPRRAARRLAIARSTPPPKNQLAAARLAADSKVE